MSPIEEIKTLLKGLSKLEQQLKDLDPIHSTMTYIDLLERQRNLNVCLVQLCWSIFGDRQDDNLLSLAEEILTRKQLD